MDVSTIHLALWTPVLPRQSCVFFHRLCRHGLTHSTLHRDSAGFPNRTWPFLSFCLSWETANVQKHGYQEVKSSTGESRPEESCTLSFSPGTNKMGGFWLAKEAFMNVRDAHWYFAVEVACISKRETIPSLPCLHHEPSGISTKIKYCWRISRFPKHLRDGNASKCKHVDVSSYSTKSTLRFDLYPKVMWILEYPEKQTSFSGRWYKQVTEVVWPRKTNSGSGGLRFIITNKTLTAQITIVVSGWIARLGHIQTVIVAPRAATRAHKTRVFWHEGTVSNRGLKRFSFRILLIPLWRVVKWTLM